MLLTLAISGYRSLRDVSLPLEKLNVITGPNGSGKSSLYRAINLLASVAQGRIISALAMEGGLHSTLWAGPEQFARAMKLGDVPVQGTRRNNAISLKLGFSSADYGYAIDLGLPIPNGGMFWRDPEIKHEAVWAGEVARPSSILVSRAGPSVFTRGERGAKNLVRGNLPPFDSMMMQAASPLETPELLELRERMRGWRFYDHLRTDRNAPARFPQVGTRTVVLSDDGADLAAALETIYEIGDVAALNGTIADAFPGSVLRITEANGLFEVQMEQEGLLRPLRTPELSDGTLRYLLLAAALLTPRPPSLMVLNEPETSLHPSLMPALARLIVLASAASQIIVVSHSQALVDALAEAGAARFLLHKELGETRIDGCEKARWEWPSKR